MANREPLDPSSIRIDIVKVLQGWQEAEGPLYRRLADALRAAIASGELSVGTRLPTERSLALSLAVSRATAVAAYDQLRDEGWVDRRQGSGTWIRRSGPAASFGEDRPVLMPRTSASFRALIEGPSDAIEFTVAAAAAPGLIDERVLEATRRGLEHATAGPGYLPAGHPDLRRALAAHLTTWGLPTDEAQLVVTTGAQQAITLVTELYARPGDAVLVEDPTYLSALDRFTAAGLRAAPVPVGPHGVRARDLHAAAGETAARFAYLIPTHHNPTGTLVPADERRALARAADELQLPLVEDLTLHDVTLGEQAPPPPIAAFPHSVPILTIGSLSKLFWGGLRVGFIRGPEPIVQRLVRMKLLNDHGSSVVGQLVAAALLEGAGEQRRSRRAFARSRYDMLAALLGQHLPEWTWHEPTGGLCMWVRAPGADSIAFAELAERHGVAVVPGPMSSATGGFGDYLRMPFVLPDDLLTEGVRRLADAWRDYRSGAVAGPRELRVVV